MSKPNLNPLYQPISDFVAYSWLLSILVFAGIAVWSKTVNMNELYYYQDFVNNLEVENPESTSLSTSTEALPDTTQTETVSP
jgi:hypothetical protein